MTRAVQTRWIGVFLLEALPMANKLIVAAGDVIEVQLTSETVVIEGVRGPRHDEPGHITNRMRLFVRKTDGKEQKYDFEEAELGVRETQRVVIVRGRLKDEPHPVNLVLYNLSSGEHEVFESGLAAYLARKPLFGPLWKAGVFASAVALIFWLVSNFVVRNSSGGLGSVTLALMFGFLVYPVFWWLCRTWDRVTERMRYKAARKRFLSDMEKRVKAFAPQASGAPPPSSAPEPSEPPEASTA